MGDNGLCYGGGVGGKEIDLDGLKAGGMRVGTAVIQDNGYFPLLNVETVVKLEEPVGEYISSHLQSSLGLVFSGEGVGTGHDSFALLGCFATVAILTLAT